MYVIQTWGLMDKPTGKTSYLYWALPKHGRIPQNSLALSVRPRLWKVSGAGAVFIGTATMKLETSHKITSM